MVRPAPTGAVGEWPWSSPEAVFILTAWDPGDERPSEEDNRQRQGALERALRPLARSLWSAEGMDPVSGHREEGVAVCGIPQADAVALGARYHQEAVFAWTPLEWTVVACAGGRRVASGWSVTEPAPGR